MSKEPLIQINIQQVLNDKLGAKANYIPKRMIKWLEDTIHQDELNEILRFIYPKKGADFCEGVLKYLETGGGIINPEKFPTTDKRIIIVSNHPLGGLDGMAIISHLTRLYGPGLRVIVNDLLMVVKPLSDVFLPINKHGRQDRNCIQDINEVLASDVPVVIFPAGLVSRLHKGGEIKDLTWNKMFVNKAVEYQRDVLPIYFSGQNSQFFYKFAKWRQRLGLKFNIEMIYLPSELLKCRGKSFNIIAGDIISWKTLRNGSQAVEQAQEIKEKVYQLRGIP